MEAILCAVSSWSLHGAQLDVAQAHSGASDASSERYLMVFHEDHIGGATEAEVAASCSMAKGSLLKYHRSIGTALAVSNSRDFAADVKAQVPTLASKL